MMGHDQKEETRTKLPAARRVALRTTIVAPGEAGELSATPFGSRAAAT